MKKITHLLLIQACLLIHTNTICQNALSLLSDTSFYSTRVRTGSFVVDSSATGSRGLLLWGRVANSDTSALLTLDEYSLTGSFISRRVIPDPMAHYQQQNIYAQKIIKSRFFDGYYLMGLHMEPGDFPDLDFHPVIIKADRYLNPIWAKKIYTINNETNSVFIKTMMECSNGDLLFAGYNKGCLVIRMSSAGAEKWTALYTTADGFQRIDPVSMVETTDKDICITGTLNIAPGNSLYDEMLFMKIRGYGAPVLIQGISTANGGINGVRIVRHQDAPGNNRFFICANSYLRQPSLYIDYQVFVTDINEDGTVTSSWSVGEHTPDGFGVGETTNDLIVKKIDDSSHYLYLTGITDDRNSHGPYFLQLKYGLNTLTLKEFSTFNQPAGFENFEGVEIKKAGASKFALLVNGHRYYGGAAARYQRFASIAIRDLDDLSGSCIRKHNPPVESLAVQVKKYKPKMVFKSVGLDNTESFASMNGYSAPVCGDFSVDPYHATTNPLNPDEITKKAGKHIIDAREFSPNTVRIFPNPVTDAVYIRSGEPLSSASVVDMAGKTICIIATQANSGNLRVSISTLPAGVYFIKMVQKSGTSLHKILVR